MDTAKKVLDTCLYWIVVVLFGFLVYVVVWQVFSRQVLGSPATWTDEAARLTFVWLGLFAAAFVFGERGHIAVDFFARKLPAAAERWLAVGVQLIVIGFAVAILGWGGWLASQNAWTQALGALPFTYGQMYLAIPVAGILILFYSLYYIQGLLRRTATPYAEQDEEDDPDVQQDKYVLDTVILPDVEQDPRASDATSDDSDQPRKGN